MTTPSPFYLAWVAYKGRPPVEGELEEFRTAQEFYLAGYEHGLEFARDMQRPLVEGISHRLDALTQQVFDLVGARNVSTRTQEEEDKEGQKAPPEGRR